MQSLPGSLEVHKAFERPNEESCDKGVKNWCACLVDAGVIMPESKPSAATKVTGEQH